MNKKIEQLYNQILSGDGNWDYSTLDQLIFEANSVGFKTGRRFSNNQITSRIVQAELRIQEGINIETNTAIVNTLKSLIV